MVLTPIADEAPALHDSWAEFWLVKEKAAAGRQAAVAAVAAVVKNDSFRHGVIGDVVGAGETRLAPHKFQAV